ncbi:MAG: homoserine dehydrogenase [Cyclobacteriaceae bacterium]|nr:homoserine dehydrogenase [Cyclobacteriaceae bacterium]
MSKQINIGLFGFGCVGQGLWKILEQRKPAGISIKKICVKNPMKPRPLPTEYFTFNPDDLLSDDSIDVIVELIDDAHAAFAILKEALKKGKHVVTANKKMLAENLEEIIRLQKKHNRSVLYEAAVCGSIPVIRTLEEYYAHEDIVSLEGIFNGSTNYILTRVLEEKLTYTEALREAQQLGFAEANPLLDVEGIDPQYKLSIALLHAHGLLVRPEDIPVSGISRIGSEEAEFARQHRFALKLVVRALRRENQVSAWVLPQFVSSAHQLAGIRHEFNAVQLTGNFAGRQLLTGKGAGSLPTALAVFSDIVSLQNDYRYNYRKLATSTGLHFSNDVVVTAWIWFDGNRAAAWQVFRRVMGGYAHAEGQVIIGEIVLGHLAALLADKHVRVVLFPDDCEINLLPATGSGALHEAAVA